MPELPDDPWSRLLVGHQWPQASALDTLLGSAGNRSAIAAALEAYADTLTAVRQGPLAAQEGVTADALRDRFRAGEALAVELSRRNSAKHAAYRTAHDCVAQLRDELSEIARDGRATITAVQESAVPAAAKAARITEVVQTCQAAATAAGGRHAANLLDALQRLLSAAGPGTTARQFAAAHGLDPGTLFR